MDDSWSGGANARRRKSAPNEHQKLLTVDSMPLIGRSNSFKMPKSSTTSPNRLSPNIAENGGGATSKSLPTTPVEVVEQGTSAARKMS